MSKIEVISAVGSKRKPTYHPKHKGLYRGKVVTVEEAEAKSSSLFITKEEYKKYIDGAEKENKARTKSKRKGGEVR